MSLPIIVNEAISEILMLLNPNFIYKKMVNINHNTILVNGKSFEISGKVHLFSVGKAASYELLAFKNIIDNSKLNSRLGECVSLTKEGHTVDDLSILELEGTHPVVSERNVENTKQFISHLEKVEKKDTVIFLLSGGASALLELPKGDMSFAELQDIHTRLLNSGKNINEMNRVRKSLSRVKDGGLLNYFDTKNIIQFITCDIPNEKLSDVSSGPLMGPDETTHPATFKAQSASKLIDLFCGADASRTRGEVYDCLLEDMQRDLLRALPNREELIVSGGEATINIPENSGKGGRSTHFVLSFAKNLYEDENNRDIHIASFGTDGGDGPTDAAGAYLNFELFKSLDETDYLEKFNSYEYFNKLGTLIKTGPTRTNVMDIRFLWRE